ncbi:MAG: hypothetical protein ACLTLQ_08340 [[Clostridium] scindens]
MNFELITEPGFYISTKLRKIWALPLEISIGAVEVDDIIAR